MIRKTSTLLAVSLLWAALVLAQTPQAPAPAATAPPSEPAATSPVTNLLAPLSGGGAVELPPLDGRVPRPDAFLGYPLGERFTHWDRMQAYLAALDAASPRVTMWEYGRTYEGRPLQLLAITSPQNLERLEEIRQEHLRLAEADTLPDADRDRILRRTPLVLWLAYGIHGNESSSSEAALAMAYLLAAAQGEMGEMLDDVVVLLDPLSNPDGRERYVSGFEQRRGSEPNPRISSAEHWEPWPGGRFNHYAVDLNRDWAWASQQETRHRLAAYRSWEPQV
ncbi:MAG TPA: M14 family zinc carboxypeptidase, partial [Thermoanaerobaculia bacterium]|nr:M14 family zinc carboxypeptidase [Thermoanaerobaculia bacterium]